MRSPEYSLYMRVHATRYNTMFQKDNEKEQGRAICLNLLRDGHDETIFRKYASSWSDGLLKNNQLSVQCLWGYPQGLGLPR